MLREKWNFLTHNGKNSGGETMEKYELIRRIHMECPICDKNHEIEERKRIAYTTIKDDKVAYEETYYFCKNGKEDECEFVTGKMMNTNLLNARNQYRVLHGLLTSYEIVEIREQYGLSQVDLSKLLGWGEATISRYESKAIQDEAYDNVLRMVKADSLMAYKLLEKNRRQFSNEKYQEIKTKITDNLDTKGKEYLKRSVFECEYIPFSEPSDSNGYQKLNIDMLERIISYYARISGELSKAKLMRMLWYADALMYKKRGKTMTGLVYRKDEMGVSPIGHSQIMELDNVKVEIEEDCECTKYKIMENPDIEEDFLDDEIQVLNCILFKFKGLEAKDVSKYVRDEKPYLDSKIGEIIPFSLAQDVRAL